MTFSVCIRRARHQHSLEQQRVSHDMASVKKGASLLLRIGRAGMQPVDSAAKRVVGLKDAQRKTRLEQKISDIKIVLKESVDPDEELKLRASIKELRTKQRLKPDPKIGAGAIERALRQLERAKWERENGRGRR